MGNPLTTFILTVGWVPDSKTVRSIFLTKFLPILIEFQSRPSAGKSTRLSILYLCIITLRSWSMLKTYFVI